MQAYVVLHAAYTAGMSLGAAAAAAQRSMLCPAPIAQPSISEKVCVMRMHGLERAFIPMPPSCDLGACEVG
jgi:hypothetical protein